MADDNPIKRLANDLVSRKKQRQSRANRTFYLLEPQTSIFMKFCKDKDYNASEIVDKLIKTFLDEVKNELLPDPPVKT